MKSRRGRSLATSEADSARRAPAILSRVLAVLFGTAAAVQYNDPDALLWVGIYGGAAGFSVLHSYDRYTGVARAAGGVLSAACLVGSLSLAPRVVGKLPLVGSESGNEMLGLLLVGCWMGWLTVRSTRRRLTNRESS